MTHIRALVRGMSMWPTLREGEEHVFDPISVRHPGIGDVVLAEHPFRTGMIIIKRIKERTEDGRWFLEGDNPDPTASEDSHAFGAVDPKLILGTLAR